MFVAAQERHLEVARLLLEANADKHKTKHNGTLQFPSQFRVQNGHLEVARLVHPKVVPKTPPFLRFSIMISLSTKLTP